MDGGNDGGWLGGCNGMCTDDCVVVAPDEGACAGGCPGGLEGGCMGGCEIGSKGGEAGIPGGAVGGSVDGRSIRALKTVSSEFVSRATSVLPFITACGEPITGGFSEGGCNNGAVIDGGPSGGGVVGTRPVKPGLPKTESMPGGDMSGGCELGSPGGCFSKGTVSVVSRAPKLIGPSWCEVMECESPRICKLFNGFGGLSGEKGGGSVGTRAGVTSKLSMTNSFGAPAFSSISETLIKGFGFLELLVFSPCRDPGGEVGVFGTSLLSFPFGVMS